MSRSQRITVFTAGTLALLAALSFSGCAANTPSTNGDPALVVSGSGDLLATRDHHRPPDPL